MRILALDVGERRIGLALSDETRRLASPLGVLERSDLDQDVLGVCRIAREHAVDTIVVGRPVGLSGRPTRRLRAVERFVEALGRIWTGTLESWDERFTTAQAERVLLQADMSRRRRRRVVDKLAATIILQSFLDAHTGPPGPNGTLSS